MNFHVIMPYYRQFLKDELIAHFSKMNVIWHPVCDPIDAKSFENNTIEWIKPLLCQPLKKGDMAYRKINDFINSKNIIDEDYYSFCHDDDMYVEGFVDKIKQQNSKIIYFSMCRGDKTPKCDISQWPPVPIILHKLEEVHVANIDMCQMIVKGEILKQTQFGYRDGCDDGRYAEMLKTRWPNDTIILPEIGINFNYFQLGRYTNATYLTKINWPDSYLKG